jgi:hypothetical protein
VREPLGAQRGVERAQFVRLRRRQRAAPRAFGEREHRVDVPGFGVDEAAAERGGAVPWIGWRSGSKTLGSASCVAYCHELLEGVDRASARPG